MEKITFGKDELAVSFPFDALVDVMGDQNIDKFLASYTSLKTQIEILKVGLKYGGKRFDDAEVKALAQNNPRSLYKVFKMFEVEFNIFASGYFDIALDMPEPSSNGKQQGKGKIGASGR